MVPRPAIDSVPSPEKAGVGLAGVVVFFLLVFAAVFWAWYPNAEKPSFSDLTWVDRPHVSGDGNAFTLGFSVRVHSFESEETSYHASVYVEDSFAAARDFSLFPGSAQALSFELGVVPPFQNENEVQVRVVRGGRAGDGNASRPVLEVVDWFPAP